MFAPMLNEKETAKNAKELLKHFDEWRYQANSSLDKALNISSPVHSDMPNGKSNNNIKERQVINSIYQGNHFKEAFDEMLNSISKMNKNKNEKKDADLIYYRYIENNKVKDICRMIVGLTENNYRRLHKQALVSFAKNYHRLELINVDYHNY